MSRQRWTRVSHLLDGALQQPEEQRRDWLQEACGGDESLRAEVEELLEIDASSGSTLGSPTRDRRLSAIDEESDSELLPVVPGYRLLESIGDGGMGRVYRAERADGEFEETVAIKVVRRGLDTDDILARFRQERQLLADLKHETIARLLGGGSTHDGRPFLVMELIEGIPIDRYCRERGLSLEARLELFRRVCEAVDYAHQSLVIHRDLKPANILVTKDGVPKLLDFGIAKVIDPGSDDVDATAPSLRRMTPGYASPEQIRGGKLTTASDVYSLGVVLFEMLTGAKPFEVHGRSLGEVEQDVIETSAPSASTVFARQADSAGLAPGEVKHWRRRLAGDIDNILKRALEKQPERRYASARLFSEDVERYLSGLPVLARPDSLSYRLARFVGRHRASTLAALLLLGATVAAFVTISSLYFESVALTARARDAEQTARFREYVAQIAAADASRRAGDLQEARSRLLDTDPGLRDFEFWYLWFELRGSARVLAGWTDRAMRQLSIHPSGELLSVSNEVLIWNLEKGSVVARRLYDRDVTAARHPSEPWVAVGRGDRHVELWNYAANTVHALVDEEPSSPPDRPRIALDWSEDGRWLASLDSRGHLSFFESSGAEGPELVSEFELGSNTSYPHVEFLAGDRPRVLLLNPEAAGWMIFNLAEGQIEERIQSSGELEARFRFWSVSSLRFSGDSQTYWMGLGDGRLMRTDRQGLAETIESRPHRGRVMALEIDADSGSIASMGSDGSVCVSDAETLELQERFVDADGALVAVTVGAGWVAASAADRSLYIWRVGKRSERHSFRITKDFAQPLGFPDPGRLSALWQDPTREVGQRVELVEVDVASGAVLERQPAPPVDWKYIVLSDDTGDHLVSGQDVYWLHALRSGDSFELGKTPGRRLAAFHPGRRRLAILGQDSVRVHDSDTGAVLSRIVSDSLAVSLSWIPASERILTGDPTGNLCLFDSETGQELTSWPGHAAAVSGIIVTRDGRLVATSSVDRTAAIWELDPPRLRRRIRDVPPDPKAMAFNHSGTRLAIGSSEGIIRIYDVESGDVVLSFPKQNAIGLFFSPDDRALVAGDSRTVSVWYAGTPIEHRVEALFEELRSPGSVLERVRKDDDWTDTERAEAIRWVADREQNPAELNRLAFEIGKIRGHLASEYEYALTLARVALELAPGNGYFLNTLGTCLYRAGQFEEAVEVLEQARELNGNRLPVDHALQALALVALGRLDEAEQSLARTDGMDLVRWGTDNERLVEEARKAIERAR